MSCAFLCGSYRKKKEPGITFHKFPVDENRRLKWISAVGRENWAPTKYSLVCSKHFLDSDFDRSSNFCTQLKDTAVPSKTPSVDAPVEPSSSLTDRGIVGITSNPSIGMSMEPSSLNHQNIDELTIMPSIDMSMEPSLNYEDVDVLTITPLTDMSMEQSSLNDEAFKENVLTTKPSIDMSMENIINEREALNIEKTVLLSIENVHLKRKLERTSNEFDNAKKKIKEQQKVIKTQEKTIKDLTSLIQSLKEKNMSDQYGIDRLNAVAPANKEFLLRQLSTVTDIKKPGSYSPELRAFALTLHYYSPAAYDYIRKTFNKAIPHEKSIAGWYKQIEASPGFTSESLNVLTVTAQNTPYTIVCSLVMDEMAIRAHTEWDGTSHHGYVDLGFDTGEDNLPIAKNAFNFMVVSVNCSWKIPVGYFLIEGLNTVQRCTLINQCLTLLHHTGVKVVSLTCDGLSTNISTAKELGCVFDVDNMKTTFKHPVSNADDVAFILDPCHMLKLVRNTIGDKKYAVDQHDNFIRWDYITKLQGRQTEEDLRLGNTITQQHVNFCAQKMKVKLASQVFSTSVADAIELCREAGEDGFEGSEATVEFIRNMNDLFDILNSRNQRHPEKRKRPLSENNEQEIIPRLNEIYSYIAGLKVARGGDSILDSARKTGFLGFLICIKSMLHLYTTLVKSDAPLLKYLPMYKFNQDHLETFFSTIRRHCGHNTNPTARQFKSAYKKSLVRSEIKHSDNSNCLALEKISILTTTSSKDPIKIINSSSDRKLLDDSIFWTPNPVIETGHDYIQCPENLSEFASTAVEFIAGFVVKQLAEKIKCIDCVTALSRNTSFRQFSLITKKDRGGLTYPSVDVFRICKRCEQIFKIAISKETNKKKISRPVLLASALKSFEHENLFPALDVHMHDTSPLENHTVQLVRAVADRYFNIRLFSHSKNLNQTKSYLRNAADQMKKNKKLNHLMGK